MKFEDPHDPKYSQMIARVAARFHALDMPISKEPEWLFKMTENLLKSLPDLVFTKEADIKRHQELIKHDFADEFAQLR